ncbi:hypothetical protein C8R42DRAFT_673090 [Lentinula raphanica]|nr:hypothetical protein C8R42DRAFT_673090 [Lentinula raphanica]
MAQHTPNKIAETRTRLSLLRRSGPSIAQEGRERRTHIAGFEDFLRRMPLELKLKKNHEIEEKNDWRRERQARFKAGLEQENGSPTASLISVSSEEWNAIRRSETLFDRVKDYIPAKILGWMQDMNDAENEALPSKDHIPTQHADAHDPTSRVDHTVMEEIIETNADPTQLRVIEIPPQLYTMAYYHRYLPLPIFTNQNLLYIKNNLSIFKTKEVSLNAPNHTTILVLSDVISKLGIDQAGIAPNEGLSFPKFQQAAANFFRFETKRDPKGEEGNRSKWTKNHFLFWTNRPNSAEMYDFWKPIELTMRLERQTYNIAFDVNNYCMAWNRVQMMMDNYDNFNSSTT